MLLGSETGRRAATSGIATAHTCGHVTRADVTLNDADSVVKISSELAQVRNPNHEFDRVLHCFDQFIFSAFGGSGFSTLLSFRRLLAFRRARLSTLLYKSIKVMCLFDFEITNVEGNRVVSKD